MGDAVALTKGIKKVTAPNAEPGFQRIFRVVNAGMDHFAIAGAGLHPDLRILFQDHDLMPGLGQCARDGQAHRARADHHTVTLKAFHDPSLTGGAFLA